MDVGAASVLHNNLGGFGPDVGGAPQLRYGGIASLNGRSIDLIIEVVGDPVGGHGAGDTSVNGLGAGGGAGGAGAGLGQVNLAFGSRTRLRYTFVWSNSAGTKADSVALSLFNWNLYDLGISGLSAANTAEHAGCSEMMMVDTADQAVTYKVASADSSIVVHQNGTETWFISNTNGSPAASYGALSKPQKANEVTLVFKEPTASFEIVFAFAQPKYAPFTADLQGCGHSGSGADRTGHTVLFDGATEYPPCDHPAPPSAAPLTPPAPSMDCDHHLLVDVSASTVLHNNLGDRGPDLGAPNLRYGGVGSLDGRSIDLLVEVVTGYDYSAPSSLSANGLDDGSGNGNSPVSGAAPSDGLSKINMAFGSRTRLRYSFVWSGTEDDKIALSLLSWCFHDLGVSGLGAEQAVEFIQRSSEGHAGCTERMTIDAADQPFSYAPLPVGTSVHVQENGTQTTFTSTANGASPTDEANEVCLVFAQPTTSFEVEFAFGEPASNGEMDLQGCGSAGAGHNILSSGKTNYPPCPHEETDCFSAGWRDAGDKSGLHSCPASAGEARLQGDKHVIIGEGSSSECCSSPGMDCSNDLLMDIHAATVLHNNLGGFGPDGGDPLLRYGGVASLDGTPIDLIIEVVGDPVGGHGAGDTSVNGLGGAAPGGSSVEGDVTVTAEQSAKGTKNGASGYPVGTWLVSVELSAKGCCGAPERDAAAAQEAADKINAMTPAQLGKVLGVEIFAILPATIVGTTRIVGGDLATFGFVVDADSYDPDSSPASYQVALATEMGPQFSEGGGGFGQINLVFGSSTRLRFTFVLGGSKGTKADKIALSLFNWNLYDLGISGITDALAAEHPDLMGMVMVDSADQAFSYTLPADAALGTSIIIHESGTQTWFMSSSNANGKGGKGADGKGGNGVPPTAGAALTKQQMANELTLAFGRKGDDPLKPEAIDTFELVFAFGEPKYGPTGTSLALTLTLTLTLTLNPNPKP